MEAEIWKDVIGYEGLYQISSLGNVKRLGGFVIGTNHGWHKRWVPESILTKHINQNGYLQTVISNRKSAKTKFIHRLVAETFILNPLNKKEVNHRNGNKTDNRVENLEWCTRRENIIHAQKMMLYRHGENNLSSKLKKEDILCIRELCNKGVSRKKIAEKYNITDAYVWQIRTKKIWKHI